MIPRKAISVLLLATILVSPRCPGDALRIPITRDTWVSSYPTEVNGNNGGSSRLKTKGIQEISLVDFPTSSLHGKILANATLHFKTASEAPQLRVTTSTVAAHWAEGTSSSYAVEPGAASFNWARQDELPWAEAGSDITAAIAGAGNTAWRFADASPPDPQGWQTLNVSNDIIAACVAGTSFGIALIDDVGSEYTRDGNSFQYILFPNRFLYSHDAGTSNAPYIEIQTIGEDLLPPLPTSAFQAFPFQLTRTPWHCAPQDQAIGKLPLPPGAIRLSWATPPDQGNAGTIGFNLRYTTDAVPQWDRAAEVPRYLIPTAGPTHNPVSTILPDLGWGPASRVTFLLQAVDRCGNISPIASLSAMTADAPNPPLRLPDPPTPLPTGATPVTCGPLTIAVIDPLDKVNPLSGQLLPPQAPAYLNGNHLFSAQTQTIRLFSARNEFSAFQIVLTGTADDLSLDMEWPDLPDCPTEFTFVQPVTTPSGPFPDPLVPFPDRSPIPPPGACPGQQFTTLFADLYVPHNASPGIHHGLLHIQTGAHRTSLQIALHVWDFTLPDVLSFIPEMNCYGLPANDIDYYRLAHLHRTNLNRLPYGWRGRNVDQDCAPAWDGNSFDWRDFDRKFGPLLDGSAFADLPRANVPLDSFYLPLNEDWPLDVESAFLGGYWADSAFTPQYRDQFVSVAAQFAQHIAAMPWSHPIFEFYLNNKVYHKETDWWRSSATWIYDEPVNTQDFWALRWFGQAFHEGAAPHRNSRKLAFRCDISRPQFQRDTLDGLLNVNICGGAFYTYSKSVLSRKLQQGQIVFVYGSSNNLDQPNTQPAAWCVDAWARGLDGVLPWQTVGTEQSWTQADALSLFYPGSPLGQSEPVASVRLKAYRQGQQDTEYFTLLQQTMNLPRWVVGTFILDQLDLAPQFSQNSPDDAGSVGYTHLTPEQLWTLHVRIGTALDHHAPPFQRKLVDLHPFAEISGGPDVVFLSQSADRNVLFLE